MKLVRPSVKFCESFIRAADEICSEGNGSFLKTTYTKENFEHYCRALNNLAYGIGLAEGNVSETIFWLVDEHDNFIGEASIRHQLTPHLFTFGGHIGYIIAPQYRRKGYGTKILELSLAEAKKLGINRVLVTCDNTNTASARIIENNGGVFENEWPNPERGVIKRRYWIELGE
jgi:predicted acetyltransferase